MKLEIIFTWWASFFGAEIFAIFGIAYTLVTIFFCVKSFVTFVIFVHCEGNSNAG